jgi:hypothetical protein
MAAGWVAASSEAPGDLAGAVSERIRIPEGQRAVDPAPEDPISVASLSGGGVLQPGLAAGDDSVAVAAAAADPGEASAQLPADVLSHLSGGLSDDGSLELQRTRAGPRGIPISMSPDASLLGEEFDFPTPSLAPPASPATD